MVNSKSWILEAVEMRKQSLVMVFLLLLSVFNLTLTVLPENAAADTLFVGGGGPGNYTDIRSAVRNATNNSTIYVFNGTYVEQIFIDTSISLIGEDRGTTIIDVVAYDSVIFVDVDWVNISRFTIIGKVDPNSTSEFINGIEMENHNNCSFTDIFFETRGSGVQLINSTGNTIVNNTFYRSQYGILASHSYENVIAGNNFTSNKADGIHLSISRDNVIALNNFSSNEEDDIHLFSSNSNAIYHNNLNSTSESWDDGFNYWDNGYPSGGNFWKDYAGIDSKSGPGQDQPGSDGIGDTPVTILGDTNRDRYPLMNATSPPSPPSTPHNFIGTAGNRQATLTWNPPLFDGFSPVTHYIVYRGTSPGQEVFLEDVGNVLVHTDQNLMNGQTYYYRVTAVNAVGESRKSDIVSVTPFTLPGPPLNLTADAGTELVILNWSAPADDGGFPIENYSIYRGNTSGGETLLGMVDSVLTFSDTDVMGGQMYFYKVAAISSVGEGPLSNEANATPLARPNQSPTCAITFPTEGATLSHQVTIMGSALDPDGTVQEVELRINDSVWMQVTGTSSWSYIWNTPTYPNGNYTLHARAYDGEDYSPIVTVNVTVDNEIPEPWEEPTQDWLWMVIVAMVVLAIVLVLAILLYYRGRKPKPVMALLPGSPPLDFQE